MRKKMGLKSFHVKSFITNVSSPEKIKGGDTLAIGCRTNNNLCKPVDTYTGGCMLPN